METDYIKLMLEACGSTVYLRDGCGTDPAAFPLPLTLIERIERWQKDYDDWDAEHCGNLSVTESHPDFPFALFNDEGESIAAALRAAMPGCSVEHLVLQKPYRD